MKWHTYMAPNYVWGHICKYMDQEGEWCVFMFRKLVIDWTTDPFPFGLSFELQWSFWNSVLDP